MRVIVQRVKEAAVAVDGKITGRIGTSLLVLAGFEAADQPDDLDWMVQQLSATLGKPVPTGVFGADMQVSLVNDGPVTIGIDSKDPE